LAEGGEVSTRQGKILGMPAAEYHSGTEMSKHQLDAFHRSPAHYQHAKLNPRPQSEAMREGSLFDTLLLEPERFNLEHVIAPKFDRRTKAGKEGAAEFEAECQASGKTAVDPDLWQQLHAMADSVRAHKLASSLILGQAQVSLFWTDRETGINLRARPDVWLIPDRWIINDIKTTRDCSKGGFHRDVAKFRYHVQAALYCDGAEALERMVPEFWFTAVEKTPPYFVACHRCTLDLIEWGRQEYRKDLERFRHCRDTDTWPGFDEPIDVYPPAWASDGSDDDEIEVGSETVEL